MSWDTAKESGTKIQSSHQNSLIEAFSKIVVPFVDGSVADDNGWDIDAATEYARAYFHLPSHVNNVSKIIIYAMSVVTEADAMLLDIDVEGAADNELYATHSYDGNSVKSTSTNFSANDIIHWEITDSNVTALSGGDSVAVKVIYRAAAAPDCATDARFRTVEIQYT